MVEEGSALGAGVGAGETGCCELSEGLEEDAGLGEGDGLCVGAGAGFDETVDEEPDKEEGEVDEVDGSNVGVGDACTCDVWLAAESDALDGVVDVVDSGDGVCVAAGITCGVDDCSTDALFDDVEAVTTVEVSTAVGTAVG
jgi:hypothetical protein